MSWAILNNSQFIPYTNKHPERNDLSYDTGTGSNVCMLQRKYVTRLQIRLQLYINVSIYFEQTFLQQTTFT